MLTFGRRLVLPIKVLNEIHVLRTISQGHPNVLTLVDCFAVSQKDASGNAYEFRIRSGLDDVMLNFSFVRFRLDLTQSQNNSMYIHTIPLDALLSDLMYAYLLSNPSFTDEVYIVTDLCSGGGTSNQYPSCLEKRKSV